MDILNNIVESMNKEQVRHFKLFLARSNDRNNRLDVRLFDYMRKSGDKYNEPKIVKQLYPDGDKNAFYRLRNRLLKDVNKSLMIQHFDDDDFVYTLYLLSLEKYYLSKNNLRVAWYFLKKAESHSKKTENYELLDIIYGDFIRLSNDMPGINPEHYIRLRNENHHQIRQLRAIEDILAVVSHKMKLTQNFSTDENPVLSLLQKTVKQYSSDKEISKSPKLRFKIYHAVTQIFLQKRNYVSLEQYLLNTYSEFTNDKVFNRNNHDTRLQMLVFIINTLFKNGKIKESLRFTEKLKLGMEEFQRLHYDKYLFYYYNSLVINYSRTDRPKAIEKLKEMRSIEKKYSLPFYQKAIELNLAVCYFDIKDFHQSIRHLNKLLTLEGYASADESFKFKIAIAELLIRYELKDFDVLEAKLRLVKKDFKDFFSRRSSVRETLMVKIISALIQKESLRSEKALLAQARQLILSPSKKDASDADILSYKGWLQEVIRLNVE
jgi:tetratricopeptide (TPR) repeat protein